VKGPKNSQIGTRHLEIIYQSFADANVPRKSFIAAVKHVCDDRGEERFF
jgi:hypothetical protein